MAPARLAGFASPGINPEAPTVNIQVSHQPLLGEKGLRPTRQRGYWAFIMVLQLTLVGLIVALPVFFPQSALYVFAIVIPLGFLVPYLWWRHQAQGTRTRRERR